MRKCIILSVSCLFFLLAPALQAAQPSEATPPSKGFVETLKAGWVKMGDITETKIFQYTIGAVISHMVSKFTDHAMDEHFQPSIIIDSSNSTGFFQRMFSSHKFDFVPVEQALNFAPDVMDQVADYQMLNWQNLKDKGELMSALVYGPPGTGKTKLATIIAKSYHYDVISGSSLATLSLERGQQKLKELIDNAKKTKADGRKYVLIIDEAEYLLLDRNSRDISYRTQAMLPLFLSLIDKGSHPNFFIMALTNKPELLDLAVYRRFPVKLEIPYPDNSVRTEILQRYLGPFITHYSQNDKLGVEISNDVKDLSVFAADSNGLSPAEIESAAEYAKTKAKMRHRLSASLVRAAFVQVHSLVQEEKHTKK